MYIRLFIKEDVEVEVHLFDEVAGWIFYSAIGADGNRGRSQASGIVISVEKIDSKAILAQNFSLHIYQRPEHDMVAVCLYHDLHSAGYSARHQIHKRRLSGWMKMRLRVFKNHNSIGRSYQQRHDGGKYITDTEAGIQRRDTPQSSVGAGIIIAKQEIISIGID